MGVLKNERDYFDAEAYYTKLKNDDFKNTYNKGINSLLIKQNMERENYPHQYVMLTGGSNLYPDKPILPGNYDTPGIGNAVSGSGKKKKSALSSTKAWTKYVSGTIDDGLNKAERVKSIAGGKKKSALSSTKAWTKYVSGTIDDGLNKAERVKSIAGGKKKSALSSTKAWTKYVSGTIDDVLNKGERVKAIAGGAGNGKLAWIPYVKKYALDHNVSYKEALSKASIGYKKQ